MGSNRQRPCSPAVAPSGAGAVCILDDVVRADARVLVLPERQAIAAGARPQDNGAPRGQRISAVALSAVDSQRSDGHETASCPVEA